MAEHRMGTPVQVTVQTVLLGDIIVVGGQRLRVLVMITLPAGGNRLAFFSGESLTPRASSGLTATRGPKSGG
jgi:hypothetical protein